jgi:chaperonin GroEL
MAGGVAVIRVGAATESEMKEIKARVEDALHATKAAVEEGIVPGGGTALLRSKKAVDKLAKTLEGDLKTGAQIIHRSLEEPARMIAHNAGHDGAVVIASILDESSPSMGFNADEEKVEDLVESGVIDPTKVVRVALQNASSIAGLLITTEALISELPEKPKGHAGHGHEGGYPDFD